MLGKLLDLIIGWLSGRSAARELGRIEQQNADLKGGIDTVRKANEAARKVEQKETGDEPDPMDRANRR